MKQQETDRQTNKKIKKRKKLKLKILTDAAFHQKKNGKRDC